MKPVLKVNGDLKKTKTFLDKALKGYWKHRLAKYGEMGVQALSEATPKRTGKTANSWRYEIVEDGENITIFWTNDNRTSQGDLIAILLQYGHGTGTGGYVKGRDYINPAIEPVFKEISDNVWRMVVDS